MTNANGFELHPGPQYLQSYSLSVERQLDAVTTLEVEYAGSHGTHLERQYDLNQPVRGSGLLVPNGYVPPTVRGLWHDEFLRIWIEFGV